MRIWVDGVEQMDTTTEPTGEYVWIDLHTGECGIIEGVKT